MYGATIAPETVTILPLDDARNPFRGEYQPWDKWVFANAVTCLDPRISAYFHGAGAQGNVVLDAYVDQAGHLVPLKLAEERRLHSYAAGWDTGTYDADWTHLLYAAGPMDAKLRASYQQALFALRAQYSLTIPGWLAANPPKWAMILPPEAGKHAGEVVMLGAPGQDQDYVMPPDEVRPGDQARVWRRYSPDGKLLATSQVNQEWWELYTVSPAVPAREGELSYFRVFEADGIISVSDMHSGKRVKLLNFDGTPIPDVQEPMPRNHNHWLGFTASELKAVYALQHGQPLPGSRPVATPAKPKPQLAPLGGRN